MSRFFVILFFTISIISCVRVSEPKIDGSLSIKVPEDTTPQARDWKDNYAKTHFYSPSDVLYNGASTINIYYMDSFANIVYYRAVEENNMIVAFSESFFKTMKKHGEAYYYRSYDLSKLLEPVIKSTNGIPKNMTLKKYSLMTIIANEDNTLSLLEYSELTAKGKEILSNFYYQNFELDEKTEKLVPVENISWSSYTNMYSELMLHIDTTKSPTILGTNSNL